MGKGSHLRVGRGPHYLILALFFLAFIKLGRDTCEGGLDFEVLWHAGRSLVEGANPYGAYLGRPGLVFKYPPWLLPIFMPFAWAPVSAAKTLWAGCELLALAGVLRWVRQEGVRWSVLAAVFVGFWGVWISHFQMGQIAIVVTAAVLPLARIQEGDSGRHGQAGRIFPVILAFWGLSSKVFWLLAGLGRPSLFARAASLFWILLTTSISLWFVHVRISWVSWEALFLSWLRSAGSGGVALEESAVRGWGNQGLPALILRLLGVPASNVVGDWIAFLFCAFFLSVYWWNKSKRLPATVAWMGWIAVATICHPLAWFHSFALCFPIAAWSLESSLRELTQSHRRGPLVLSLVALILIGGVSPRFPGGGISQSGMLLSPKSIGVLLLLIVAK